MCILQQLVPSERLFPHAPDIIPIYPERVPPVVTAWCFMATGVNLVTLAVGTLTLRNAAPVLLFLVFMLLGPLNLLFFWRSLIKRLNRSTDGLERRMILPVPYPSVEWLAISALIMTCAMNMGLLIQFADMRPS